MKVASVFALLLLLSPFCKGQQLLWEANVNPENFRTNGVQFTSDGSEILAGTDCHPAKIRRFETKDGSLTWDYTLGEGLLCVMGVGINASEKYVAAIEEYGNLLIFDYTQETPELVNSIKLNSEYAFAATFSPNSKHVAVAGTEGKLFVAHAETGKILHDINAHGDWVLSVCYSSNGTLMATGANDRRVKIWDTSGTLLHTLIGHKGNVTSVHFAKDGKTLFSASADGTLIKWSIEKEEPLWTLDVSEKDLHDFALSPDENFAAVVAKDKTLSLWNIASQNKLSSYTLPGNGGKTVDWSPTQKQVCVGTEQGDLMLLDVSAALSTYPTLKANEFVALFPSPVTETSQVNYYFNEREALEMKLYKIDGSLVKSHYNLPTSGSLSFPAALEAGLYFMEFTERNGSVYREVFSRL